MVAAQEKDIACEYGDQVFWGTIASEFDGEWTFDNLEGILIAGSYVQPLPVSKDVERITLKNNNSLGDGTMVMTHPDAPSWIFDGRLTGIEAGPVPKKILTLKAIENLTGCQNDEMARLAGNASMTIQGQMMDFSFRLLILSPEILYGIMHISGEAQGQQFNAWRSISLVR